MEQWLSSTMTHIYLYLPWYSICFSALLASVAWVVDRYSRRQERNRPFKPVLTTRRSYLAWRCNTARNSKSFENSSTTELEIVTLPPRPETIGKINSDETTNKIAGSSI